MSKITERLKPYQRRCRKYGNFRFLFQFIAVLTIINLGANVFNSVMNLASQSDRAELHEAQREIEENQKKIEAIQDETVEAARISRAMLRPRAVFQIWLVKKYWHEFSASRQQEIIDNWDASQYSVVEPAPKRTK